MLVLSNLIFIILILPVTVFIDSITTALYVPILSQWSQNGTTVAGSSSGTNGSSLNLLNGNLGIYVADDGTLYVADTNNNRTVLIQSSSTTAITSIRQGSQSNITIFNYPSDVFVTRSSVYIMDTYNFIVQKFVRNLTSSGIAAGIYGTSGGSSDLAKLGISFKLFVDNNSNLYVSDYANDRVLMFSANSTNGTNGVIVVGTGGTGSNANQLNDPLGLFVVNNTMLYIADSGNNRIQLWTIGGTTGMTVAGAVLGGSALSQLNGPSAVLVDSYQFIYIADSNNNRILRWAPSSSVGVCIAGCSGSSGVASNQLNGPSSIAFDSSYSLYVSDSSNNRVQKFQISNGQSTYLKAPFNKPTLFAISIILFFSIHSLM